MPPRRSFPVLILALALVAPAAAQARVAAFPRPGSDFASPQTQISLRGIAPQRIGEVIVTGSRSGRHSGQVKPHSDGRGASFVLDQPLRGGERVTVRTARDIVGARNGDYRLRVARPGPPLRPPPIKEPRNRRSQTRFFHSRKDLVPPEAKVRKRSRRASRGKLFLAPKLGPGDNGQMVLDERGELVWFNPLRPGFESDDFRAQTYRGKPVLTWWEGFSNLGTGNGEGVILDRRYREIARVQAGNGYFMDPHEFELTDRGTALIGSLAPTARNLKKLGGRRRGVVLDTVVQEIDVATGLVLFEWHSLDDVALRESYVPAPKDKKPWDYFHINSIEEVRGGDLLVSGRNTWSAVKIGRPGAKVAWKLGGKRSDFRIEKGAGFAWQHDVRQRPSGVITLFDNGAFPPVHKESRGLGFRLRGKRAMKVRDYRHKPKLLTSSQGNVQVLRNGNVLIGWGALPVVSEFSSAGKLLFELTLPKPLNPGPPPKTLDDLLKAPKPTQSYRAFRQRWSGLPAEPPAIVASTNSKRTKVYMSWNGATNVARWRVLAGGSPESLRPVARVRNEGFETAVTLKGSPAYVAVQPRDRRGRAFAPSRVIRPRRER